MTRLGKEIDPTLDTAPSAAEFMCSYIWFNKAVARWLDIALYKAMQRIIKAVQLDRLTPVDELVRT